MDHGLATLELVKAIQEARLREAERRRALSRRNTGSELSERTAMRMAVGPGFQFGGVTDGVLAAVTGQKPARMAR